MNKPRKPGESGARVKRVLDSLGPRLKMLRETRDLTMREAARRAGVSPSTISRLEAGEGIVSIECFLRLCAAFDVKPGRVLDVGE